jgi:PAS domain S-box-containing protein
VESSDDAVIGEDLNGIATSWNAGAERIFGFAAEEMIGRPIPHTIPPDRRGELAAILDVIRRGERVEPLETTSIRKDGRRIVVSLSVSPIKDSSGRVVGTSRIVRDVTERRRLEADREQLLGITQRAGVEAQASSRSRDEFLAMVGHELRNSLSAVRNAVACVRLDSRQPERALDIAWRQTERLNRLVEDLLDTTRISQGCFRLNTQRVALMEIIAHAVETTRFLVEDRGHTLTVSLPADRVPVDGDPMRLEQIVVNLVSNAAKYTEPGGCIELLVERHGAEAVVRVRDSGIGISPDLLPRIFDFYVRGESTAEHVQGGLGIGLAVVRSLVALHGGRIEARSEGLGKGAEFVVHLPAVADGGI